MKNHVNFLSENPEYRSRKTSLKRKKQKSSMFYLSHDLAHEELKYVHSCDEL